MKWLVLLLALSGCSTAVHECLQEHPEPVSGFDIGANGGAMQTGAAGGAIVGILIGIIEDATPEHQKLEEEYDECLKQKKTAN